MHIANGQASACNARPESFKSVNDKYGHVAGTLAQQFAKELQMNTRSGDWLPLGGDDLFWSFL